MSGSAYTGIPGSGKTYEVVEGVIIPAVQAGRRIVTNIEGLHADKIAAYIERNFKLRIEPRIVVVDDETIRGAYFFPREDSSVQTVCGPGDLVILDEAYDFFGEDEEITPEVMRFIRKHRHQTDAERGTSCDIVYITQDVMDLHLKVRRVLESLYHIHKVKELGMTSTYVVDQYTGGRLLKRKLTLTNVKRYNPEIFECYKSYQVAEGAAPGQEVPVDKRQNLLNNKWVWVKAVAAVLMLLAGPVYLYQIGKKLMHAEDKAQAADAAAGPVAGGPLPSGAVLGSAPPGGRPGAPAVEPKAPELDSWRIVGTFQNREQLVMVLRGDGGGYRYVHDVPNLRLRSELDVSAVLDGRGITMYSGSRSGPGAAPLKPPGLFK